MLSIIFAALFVCTWRTAITQECLNDCFTRRDYFQECSVVGTVNNYSSTLLNGGVNLTFLSSANSTQLQLDLLIRHHMPFILTLACSSSKEFRVTSSNSTLCYTVKTLVQEACPPNCRNSSCFTAVAHIFNADSSEALDPSSLVTLLRKEESLTALHLASVPLLEAAAATSTMVESVSVLRDVPIVSWAFVGLGLLVSTVTLTKPLWWDRCFKILSERMRKKR